MQMILPWLAAAALLVPAAHAGFDADAAPYANHPDPTEKLPKSEQLYEVQLREADGNISTLTVHAGSMASLQSEDAAPFVFVLTLDPATQLPRLHPIVELKPANGEKPVLHIEDSINTPASQKMLADAGFISARAIGLAQPRNKRPSPSTTAGQATKPDAQSRAQTPPWVAPGRAK